MARQWLSAVSFSSRGNRLLAGMAAIGVLSALGCQAPLADPGSLATAINPQSTPAQQPSASDASAAQDTATVDSDLPPDQESALETLLDSQSLQDYLPSDLIHDGGVSLFRTLALAVLPSAPPAHWAREKVTRGARHLTIRKDGGDAASSQAKVVVSYKMTGTLAYRYAADDKAETKAFTERFTRAFRLNLTRGAWALAKVSPIQIVSVGNQADYQISGFSATPAAMASSPLSPADLSQLSAPEQAPVFAPGETMRLTLQVHKATPGTLFAFANTVGRGGERGARVLMQDQITLGAGGGADHLFSLALQAPLSGGLHHLALDVVDAQSFAPGGVYGGVALGVSFKVQAAP